LENALFIGDTITDFEEAKKIGLGFIGIIKEKTHSQRMSG